MDETAPSDEDLAARVRAGDAAAYRELWERHARAGLTVARSLGGRVDPDDLVSEAYTLILGALQRGYGPTGAFRPYLFTTIRNLAARWGKSNREHNVDDDIFANLEATEPELGFADKTITVQAFRSLPERWKTVLWYTEVEGLQPREAGLMMGLAANAVAALAYRAREGLRQAWLQAHINSASTPEECRWSSEHMGEHARGTLSRRDAKRFDEHVAGCTRCSILIEELDHVAGRLAIMILPLLIGGTAATSYLASLTGAPVTPISSARAPRIPRNPARLAAVGAGGILLAATAFVGIGSANGLFSPAPVPEVTVAAPQTPIVTEPVVEEPVEEPEPEPTPTPEPTSGVDVALPPAETPSPVDPPPPADWAAAAPTIVGVLASELTYLPTLTGTAEPRATVVITDETNAVIATVTASATGRWRADLIAAQPHDGQMLRARQTDRAGNVSKRSPAVGPYTFDSPTLPNLIEGGAISWTTLEPVGLENGVLEHVLIEVSGTLGESVLIYVDGSTSGTRHLLDSAVISRISAADLAAGIHTFGVRYVDADGRLGKLLEVSVTTGL